MAPENSFVTGVIFEYSRDGRVEDVQARRITGPSFVASGAARIRFERARSKETYCKDSGFGPSNTNGIIYYAAFRDPRYNNELGRTESIEVVDSTYGPQHPSCDRHLPVLYPDEFDRLELRAEDFTFEKRFSAVFPF